MEEVIKELKEAIEKLKEDVESLKKSDSKDIKDKDIKDKDIKDEDVDDMQDRDSALVPDDPLRDDLSELKQAVEVIGAEKQALENKVIELEAAAGEAVDAERESFLNQHSDKFPPAQRSMFKRHLELAAREPDTYSFSPDKDTKLSGEEAFRAEVIAMPKHPLFDEYGRRGVGGGSGDKDDDRKVSAYAKENDVDVSTTAGWRKAYNALIKSGAIKPEEVT